MNKYQKFSAASESNATLSTDSKFCWPSKVDVVGVQISEVNYQQAVDAIVTAAELGESAIVSCHAVHAVVTIAMDEELRQLANRFEMITPDGQPVRWAMNWLHRSGLSDRVYGPELMLRLCQRAAERSLPIYLYGGNDQVSTELQANLLRKFPQLVIAGAEAPPFRPLTAIEDQAMIERIQRSGAKLVFIGLGCPKQDRFAADHRDTIRGVQLCVGAAFDFHAGAKPMAPRWMQRCGLEWFFRLMQEPRRLWQRYLTTNSIFMWRFAKQYCFNQNKSNRRSS